MSGKNIFLLLLSISNGISSFILVEKTRSDSLKADVVRSNAGHNENLIDNNFR